MSFIGNQEIPHQYTITFKGMDKKTRILQTNLFFLGMLFRQIKSGQSPIVAICGKQQGGKSFIGVWLSAMMCHYMGKGYDPTKNTFYYPMDAIRGLENKNKEPLMIDEAADILDAREWYEQSHQALKSIINTQAYKTMLFIFISPFIIDIDKAFRKHFDFLIVVKRKGAIKVFRYIKKYDAHDDKTVVRRMYLDDIQVNLSQIPKGVWKKYRDFSIEEKEKIRIKRLQKIEMKEKENKQPKSKIDLEYIKGQPDDYADNV